MKLITAHRILITAGIAFFIFYAPPLVVTEAEVDRLVSVTRDAVKSVLSV